MKRRAHQIVMVACQLCIFVAAIMLSGGPDGGAVLLGILLAATITPTILVLMDQPQGLLRWNMAALYPLAFATMVRLAMAQPEAEFPVSVVVGVVIGAYGCVLVACGVATMRWGSRLAADGEMRKAKSADAVIRRESNQLTPGANERAARVLRVFIIETLSDLVISLLNLLFHCLI